jgi:hypothetical protein
MGRSSRLARTAAIAGVLAASPPARASEATRPAVAVAPPDARDALLRESETRLGAELRAAGFDVIREPDAAGAIASFSLARAPGGGAAVDVSLTDRLTRKTSTRRIEADAATGELAPATLAIRAVELLRASLVELGAPGEPAPERVPVAVERLVAPLRDERPRRPVVGNAVAIAAGVLVGGEGLAPAAVPVVRASVAVAARWGLRITVAAPSIAETVGTSAGSASIRQELAAADVVVALRPREDVRIVPYLAAGAGVFHLHVRGASAGPPFVGRSDDAWAALATAGLGLALRLGARTAIVLDAAAVVTAPGAAVDVGGAIVARAGRPSELVTLGAAWAL